MDIPGLTAEMTHVIKVSDNTPVKVHQYSFHLHYDNMIKKEMT